MSTASALLSALLLSQAPAGTPATPEEKAATERANAAAEAAERAAAAAERAAAANARISEAVKQLAQELARAAPDIAPAPAEPKPAEPKPPEPTPAETWDITVGMGLIFITGNASTVTFNGLASAERKTKDWIYSIQAVGVYGESRAPTLEGQAEAPNQVLALNAALQLRADRRFTPQLSGYLLTRGETDHVRSVELRGSGEAGLGVIWWDEKHLDESESFLRTDLALNYARELRFQYYPTRTNLPDVSLGGPRVGATFRHGLTKDVSIVEELSVLASFIESSRLLISSQTQLNVRLTRALTVATTFRLQYDSQPAEGKLPMDTALSVNASVTF